MSRFIIHPVLRIAFSLLLVFAVCWSYPAPASEPWKFVVVADSRGKDNGINSEALGPLAEQIAKTGADFVLFPGDLVTGSRWASTLRKSLEQWRTTMGPIYKAGIKVYPVSGNHEWGNTDLPDIWRQVFAELPSNGPAGEEKMTYSFIHKNAFIVGLDQYFDHPHRVKLQWLRIQLAGRDAKAQPHVFAFGHEPAYAANHNDCLDSDEQARDVFVQNLVNRGGRLYFCGHDHFYDHAEIRGFLTDNQPVVFHQVIIATAGAPIYHWSGKYDGRNGVGKTITNLYHDDRQGGYCLVEIDDLKVTVKYVRHQDDGGYSVADSFSYTLPQQ